MLNPCLYRSKERFDYFVTHLALESNHISEHLNSCVSTFFPIGGHHVDALPFTRKRNMVVIQQSFRINFGTCRKVPFELQTMKLPDEGTLHKVSFVIMDCEGTTRKSFL